MGYKQYFLGLCAGFLVGWILFGFRMLPETIWQYTFIGDPIKMEAGIHAPVLINMPSGRYYYIYEYTDADDVWYLTDYIEYHDGRWGERIVGRPLTLGMNESYDIIMMPALFKILDRIY